MKNVYWNNIGLIYPDRESIKSDNSNFFHKDTVLDVFIKQMKNKEGKKCPKAIFTNIMHLQIKPYKSSK